MSIDFHCPACGLKGHVSGGDDAGMLVGTTTIYCATCDTLQDAVVKKHHYAKVPCQIKPRCEQRPIHPVKVWHRELPCPRCGQGRLKVDERGVVTMWD